MAVATDPHLTQRMTNLAKANDSRIRKARLKKALAKLEQAEACRKIAKQLETDYAPLGAMTVEELLLCIQGVGKTRARNLARLADRTPLARRVRELTDPRRADLARVLYERADERADELV